MLLDLVVNSPDLLKSSDPAVNHSRINTFYSSLRTLLLKAGTEDAKAITEDLKQRPFLTGHALYVGQGGKAYILCRLERQGGSTSVAQWPAGGGAFLLFDLEGQLLDVVRLVTQSYGAWCELRFLPTPGENDAVAEFSLATFRPGSITCSLKQGGNERSLRLSPTKETEERLRVWLENGKCGIPSLFARKRAFLEAADLARAEPNLAKGHDLWKKALALADEVEDITAVQTRIFVLEGDPEGVVGDLTYAIQRNPKEPSLYCRRGLAYKAIGRGDLAAADFREALQIAPGYGPAQAELDALK